MKKYSSDQWNSKNNIYTLDNSYNSFPISRKTFENGNWGHMSRTEHLRTNISYSSTTPSIRNESTISSASFYES